MRRAKAKGIVQDDTKKYRYLVAVKAHDGTELFGFKTEEDRAAYMRDIAEMDPTIEMATTEVKP